MTVPDTYKVIKSGTGYIVYQMGKIIIVRMEYIQPMTITGCPASLGYFTALLQGTNTQNAGIAKIYGGYSNCGAPAGYVGQSARGIDLYRAVTKGLVA